jgi:hypothetical protein
MASEAHLYLIEPPAVMHFGRPGWTPGREGRVTREDKKPSQAHCPECRGLIVLSAGTLVYCRDKPDGVGEKLEAELLVRAGWIGEPGYFFVPDGRKAFGVVVPASKANEVLFDSDLVVTVCGRCQRCPEVYKGRLRGSKHTSNAKRMSHRAGRIVGKPDSGMNPYLKLAEQQAEAERKRREAETSENPRGG